MCIDLNLNSVRPEFALWRGYSRLQYPHFTDQDWNVRWELVGVFFVARVWLGQHFFHTGSSLWKLHVGRYANGAIRSMVLVLSCLCSALSCESSCTCRRRTRCCKRMSTRLERRLEIPTPFSCRLATKYLRDGKTARSTNWCVVRQPDEVLHFLRFFMKSRSLAKLNTLIMTKQMSMLFDCSTKFRHNVDVSKTQ